MAPFLDNDAAGTGQLLEIDRYLADFTLDAFRLQVPKKPCRCS